MFNPRIHLVNYETSSRGLCGRRQRRAVSVHELEKVTCNPCRVVLVEACAALRRAYEAFEQLGAEDG